MDRRITVMVPCYNVEAYISECIDSIMKRTCPNFEIVIIDDGSLDHTYEICSGLSSMDSKIKLWRKNNGGVSSA